MARRTLYQLIDQRLFEAEREIGRPFNTSWDFGKYPHFRKKRGYGVTFILPRGCKMRFSDKLVRANPGRQEGVIRHEIGHVVDALVLPGGLGDWANRRGYGLPRTPERRADAIAEALWGDQIFYDDDLVQTTDIADHYHYPRPTHLGL